MVSKQVLIYKWCFVFALVGLVLNGDRDLKLLGEQVQKNEKNKVHQVKYGIEMNQK